MVVRHLAERTADEEGEGGAEHDAGRVDRQGFRSLGRTVVVGDDGVGGRVAACFADRHPDACDEQEQEAVREPAERGHQRPQRDAQRDDGDAVVAVGSHRDGDPHQGVEQRERRACEEPELGVGEPEGGDHRLGQHAEQRTVDEVQRVDQREGQQYIPSVGCAAEVAAGGGGVGRHAHRSTIARDIMGAVSKFEPMPR